MAIPSDRDILEPFKSVGPDPKSNFEVSHLFGRETLRLLSIWRVYNESPLQKVHDDSAEAFLRTYGKARLEQAVVEVDG